MQIRSSRLAEQARSQSASHSSQLKQREAAQVLDTRDVQSAQRKTQGIANRSSAASQLKLLQAKMAGKADTTQRVEDDESIQAKSDTAQLVEDEEILQGKFTIAQRVEEDEPLQGKFDTVQCVEDDELLQGKFDAAQRVEEEEPVQAKRETAQLEEKFRPNNTGLPNQLKSGIESLSGMSMDHVKVHYNSSQPAQLNAHAFAQGNEIHVAPGQEQHLPHEAWHVVQQAQGRVKPTMQMKAGVPINDDVGLEHEADVMGAKAVSMATPVAQSVAMAMSGGNILQRREAIDNRQLQIDELQNAFDGIADNGQMASQEEIELHDDAIHAGQHHRNRVVRRRALRSDLQGRIDALERSQTRDNLRLPNLSGQQAVQLFVAQTKLTGTIDNQSKSKYQVTYTGKKSDFKSGDEPGGSGITGVTGYSASVEIADAITSGDQVYRDSVGVNASDREYHRGHILASALGGSGAADNVFLQDGGQNTTGKWPSFERQAGGYRDAGSQSQAMSYRVTLLGSNLKYDQGL
ncbi:eCIS core domain-containing protein [Undibacterium flavidum]|uniref:DUF4157 domain-containing protein n=1 Tax=Undibacterium flavidum TaxID=2762297 RepID=A0ABR6Y7T3_9BURK|nr:DUF4157 domain-containing protein [Undibacterium flavidum]MBC3872673.1 DUF4157 domain-containing protein [Undibacterium flavidum]